MYNHEDILKYLTSEDKEELALWESLFNNGGFKLLLTKLEEQFRSAQVVLDNAPNWDMYNYHRGVRDALSGVLNLEATVEFIVQQKVERAMSPDEALTEQEDFA